MITTKNNKKKLKSQTPRIFFEVMLLSKTPFIFKSSTLNLTHSVYLPL